MKKSLLIIGTLGLMACGQKQFEFQAVTNDLHKVASDDTIQNPPPNQEKPKIPIEEGIDNPALLDSFACVAGDLKHVLICHIPPGNPQARHTICVGRSAVKAHVGHHVASTGEQDHLGSCDFESPNPDLDDPSDSQNPPPFSG